VAVGEIEIVHGLVMYRYELASKRVTELAAAVAQVTLDFEIHVESRIRRFSSAAAGGELLAHPSLAHERDVAHHACHRQAAASGGFPS